MSMKIDLSQFKRRISNIKKLEAYVMPKAYKDFVDSTPVKTGNARNKTVFKQYKIMALYPYANILNKGRQYRRGSNQAPQGMSRPTFLKMVKYTKQFMRSV